MRGVPSPPTWRSTTDVWSVCAASATDDAPRPVRERRVRCAAHVRRLPLRVRDPRRVGGEVHGRVGREREIDGGRVEVLGHAALKLLRRGREAVDHGDVRRRGGEPGGVGRGRDVQAPRPQVVVAAREPLVEHDGAAPCRAGGVARLRRPGARRGRAPALAPRADAATADGAPCANVAPAAHRARAPAASLAAAAGEAADDLRGRRRGAGEGRGNEEDAEKAGRRRLAQAHRRGTKQEGGRAGKHAKPAEIEG